MASKAVPILFLAALLTQLVGTYAGTGCSKGCGDESDLESYYDHCSSPPPPGQTYSPPAAQTSPSPPPPACPSTECCGPNPSREGVWFYGKATSASDSTFVTVEPSSCTSMQQPSREGCSMPAMAAVVGSQLRQLTLTQQATAPQQPKLTNKDLAEKVWIYLSAGYSSLCFTVIVADPLPSQSGEGAIPGGLPNACFGLGATIDSLNLCKTQGGSLSVMSLDQKGRPQKTAFIFFHPQESIFLTSADSALRTVVDSCSELADPSSAAAAKCIYNLYAEHQLDTRGVYAISAAAKQKGNVGVYHVEHTSALKMNNQQTYVYVLLSQSLLRPSPAG